MSIYVYITEQCRKDAKKQNYEDNIERFAKKIERDQSSEAFDRFPPPHLKKRFERQIRMVADERHLGEHTVVIFLRIFVRGGSEYAQFGDSDYKIVPGVDKMADELSDEKLRGYIESRQDPPPPPPPAPDADERSYLDVALSESGNIYHDSHCCETHLWVESIQTDKYAPRLSDFVDPVFETLDGEDLGISEARCKKDPSYGILYRSVPEKRTVLLFTPFHETPPIDEIRKSYGHLAEAGGSFDLEDALRRAKRAYSHELLLNPDAWFEIQKDSKGNMALSPEEIDVLESTRAADGDGFPLFINGRAGSGKSTILQYLFSEFLYHHLTKSPTSAPPLLFACNSDLLAQAERSVRALLLARHRQTTGTGGDDWLQRDETAHRLKPAFKNFHLALLDLLDPDEKGDFPLSRCIDYGRFKAWWERKFSKTPSARKLYGPDTSWHVIRTYIKGTSSEGLLDPDDYREIPSKHKSVSVETYALVFEKVWPRYEEEQKERGLWDYQDVTRKVLESGSIRAEHPAVFCDEAQDFTRIELEAIDRHCLFNERTLHPHDAGRVPIAFAGDPFQTLNPTGFRWEATKAFFAEKFIKNYDGQKSTRDLNFRELSYNYRSSRNVVRFCNSLQLVRSVVFDIPDIRPQIHWQDEEDSPSVVWFDRAKAEVLDILKEQSEVRIIVPCEEGDEATWVRENGLTDYVEFDEADVPKNVVSPVRVKGLEFTRVVIFGFGGACPEILKKVLREDGLLEGDEAIEPQYFLNRLYVSASRPRKRLFVVDYQKDYEELWKPIFANQEALTVRSNDTAAWEHELGSLLPGNSESWEADREDPAKTAESLAEEGRLRKDRVLLRQAAQSFESAKLPKKAKRCRAEALEIEENWIKAAEGWEGLGDAEAALDAAWQDSANGRKFIIELAERHPEIKPQLEYEFCRFLESEESTFDDSISLLSSLKEQIELKRSEEILTRPAWNKAVELLITKLLTFQDASSQLWSIQFERLKAIADAGLRIGPSAMGQVAFASGKLKDAYQLWSKVPAERRKGFEEQYLKARFASLPYPESLEVGGELLRQHNSATDANTIINLFRQEGDLKLKPRHVETVAKAYLMAGNPEDGIHLITKVQDPDLLIAYLEALSGRTHIETALLAAARLLLPSDDYDQVLSLFERGEYLKRPIPSLQDLLATDPNAVGAILVKALGMVGDLKNDNIEKIRRLARFVASTFGGEAAWSDEVHPLQVGRALEAIGAFKETLLHYERVKNSTSVPDAIRILAKERWVYTKLQHAIFERDHGSRKKAEDLLSEAKVEYASLASQGSYSGIDSLPKSLPDTLPAMEDESAPDGNDKSGDESVEEPVETRNYSLDESFGPYRIRVNATGERLNLEHSESLEQLAVKASDSTVHLEGTEINPTEDGAYEIPSWGLNLSFSRDCVELRRTNGMRISIPFRTHDGTPPK